MGPRSSSVAGSPGARRAAAPHGRQARAGVLTARRATLQTIADHVGVSRATVSNAYNHPERLGDDLRERVLGAARELGYPGPDPAARRLRQQRAGAVGLVLTEALSYAFSDAAAVVFLEGLA